MISNRKHKSDPAVNAVRDRYLLSEEEFRNEELKMYKETITRTKHIHANLLFTTKNGFSVLKNVCQIVTCVSPDNYNNSWRDLAVKLGYHNARVKYIDNLRGAVYDPTEEVLKWYALNQPEGTVGDVLQALLELGFVPALHQAQQYIPDFLAEVAAEKNTIQAPLQVKESDIKEIVKAAFFKPSVPAALDPVLLPHKTTVMMVQASPPPDHTQDTQHRIKPSAPPKRKNYCKYVLLTFAADGQSVAYRAAEFLRGTRNKNGASVGVVMLCENENKIMHNPGQIIPEILSKMDFVIPVLTAGYFRALRQPDTQARLVDERYINFIYDVLITKYIHSNCSNIQVRPLIPSGEVETVYQQSEFLHCAMFSPWKTDDDICSLADNIVQSRRRKL